MQLQAIGSAYMYFTLPFEFRTTNWCGGSSCNAATRSGVSAFLCTKPAAARRSPLLGASASEFAHAAARNAAPTAIKARCEGLFIRECPVLPRDGLYHETPQNGIRRSICCLRRRGGPKPI